ncbi:MAG TPA: CHAD domain-containing protein, partial [Pirellulales bacterium]
MAFELKPGERISKGIRRIARKELDKSLELLIGEKHESRDETVHEVRKSFKKIRAVLRMVRPAIGDAAYRTENICFRDAARPLTKVRDAKILVETLDAILDHFHEHVAGRSFHETREALQTNLRSVRREVLDEQDAPANIAAIVKEARPRIKEWSDVPNKWRSIGDGVRDVHRRARDSFDTAKQSPSVETLHEWRKQAKYLRYQLEILRPLWPERMEELADEADRMTELLGDDHDAAVLRQMLADDPDKFGGAASIETLLALIDRRRTELQQEAT